MPIVFGGVHPTLSPQSVISLPFVDYVMVGEGEEALPALLECLGGDRDIETVPNLFYKKFGKTHRTPLLPYIRDLDSLPLPNKDLYSEVNPFVLTNYCIVTSRGCPFGCTYCSNNAYHKLYAMENNHVRRRSPQNVINELTIAKEKHPIDNIFFVDDIFTMSKGWLKEFLTLYKEAIDIPFTCLGHPKTVNAEIAQMLAKAKCYSIEFGFQTPNDHLRLNILERTDSRKEVKQLAETCQKNSLAFTIDHIFGLPGDDLSDYRDNLHYYNEIRPNTICKYWLNFYPGTAIIEKSLEHGLLSPEEISSIENGALSFDYKIGGHLVRFPDELRKSRRIAFFMELMVFLPKPLVTKLISHNVHKYMPGSETAYLIAMGLRAFLRGELRTVKVAKGQLTKIMRRVWK